MGVVSVKISSLHIGRIHLSFDHLCQCLTILVKYAYSTFPLLSMSQVTIRIEG